MKATSSNNIELGPGCLAEEIESGLWAIRQTSRVGSNVNTVYLTSDTIKHLAGQV